MRQRTQKLESAGGEGRVLQLPGPPTLEVAIRRSSRARRVSLRVSGLDGRATLTMPSWYPEADALRFLREKESWLRQALDRVPARQPVAPGGDILFKGQFLRVREGAGHHIRLEDDHLIVPLDPSGTRTAQRVETFLKASARAVLMPVVSRHTEQLGRAARAIALRDTRSRWGSCTADGRLMFSWRLIMAPPQVLDYVAAHEVAHLAYMDHSRAFWDCVERLMPDYTAHRHWLRTHGPQLHSYCFKARSSAESG